MPLWLGTEDDTAANEALRVEAERKRQQQRKEKKERKAKEREERKAEQRKKKAEDKKAEDEREKAEEDKRKGGKELGVGGSGRKGSEEPNPSKKRDKASRGRSRESTKNRKGTSVAPVGEPVGDLENAGDVGRNVNQKKSKSRRKNKGKPHLLSGLLELSEERRSNKNNPKNKPKNDPKNSPDCSVNVDNDAQEKAPQKLTKEEKLALEQKRLDDEFMENHAGLTREEIEARKTNAWIYMILLVICLFAAPAFIIWGWALAHANNNSNGNSNGTSNGNGNNNNNTNAIRKDSQGEVAACFILHFFLSGFILAFLFWQKSFAACFGEFAGEAWRWGVIWVFYSESLYSTLKATFYIEFKGYLN
jgi:hypothetical protein